ncbi:MAG: hypothetical protein DHS20C11_01400 [Lysobacteraceae bacterium]|nr:MAG: hypothetical protein DHS20C11_01400 [Xanthomonadaceae bacterium]
MRAAAAALGFDRGKGGRICLGRNAVLEPAPGIHLEKRAVLASLISFSHCDHFFGRALHALCAPRFKSKDMHNERMREMRAAAAALGFDRGKGARIALGPTRFWSRHPEAILKSEPCSPH